jgi:two-component sensor histidine kinase
MTHLAPRGSRPDEQVLLHELDHRINNESASAISAVSLAAMRTKSDEVKEARSAIAEVLHHYADVHRALRMPEHDTLVDAAAYLRRPYLSISRTSSSTERLGSCLSSNLCNSSQASAGDWE